MAWEWRDLRMKMFIRENIQKEKRMEKVFIDGSMEKYTMESGVMDFNKVLEFGKECKEIIMRATGSNHKQMDMVLSNTQMELDIRVIGSCLIKVDLALNIIIMARFLKETSIMTSLMDKEK
jgi:hypothetical protein